MRGFCTPTYSCYCSHADGVWRVFSPRGFQRSEFREVRYFCRRSMVCLLAESWDKTNTVLLHSNSYKCLHFREILETAYRSSICFPFSENSLIPFHPPDCLKVLKTYARGQQMTFALAYGYVRLSHNALSKVSVARRGIFLAKTHPTFLGTLLLSSKSNATIISLHRSRV